MRQLAVMVTLTIKDGEEPTVTVESSFQAESPVAKDYAASILDRGSQLLRGAPTLICTCEHCTRQREMEAAEILKATIEGAKGGYHEG